MTTLHPSRRTLLVTAIVAWLTSGPIAQAGDRSDLAAEIVVQSLALLGVPYRWGGNDPTQGLDCSGLVRHVFRSVVAIELPRRSEQISRIGRGVRRADIRAGDLVFFNTLGHPFSHVAVYVGEGRFVHAPSRNGQVRVDDMDDRYWRARFNGARRIEMATTRATPVPGENDRPSGNDRPAAPIARSEDVLGGP